MNKGRMAMTMDHSPLPPVADDQLIIVANEWHRLGHRLVFAFVIQTWGSSPRQVGSIMLIRDDQTISGSVSGGCVEGAVVEAAMTLMDSAGCQRLDFGVADADAWEVGLSCGGKISIWLVAVAASYFSADLLNETASAIAAREPFGLQFDLANGQVQLVPPPDASVLDGTSFIFLQMPRPRLVIVGAVHISQHLAHLAKQIGFCVSIIDPRGIFATPERFPGVALYNCWPDEMLAEMALDPETAMVTLTHDPKIDDAALKLALSNPLFYVASLGSKKTHAARLERLAAAGFDAAACERIHGPAGLDIGAKTPAEIAVSVAAELVSAYRQRQGAGDVTV